MKADRDSYRNSDRPDKIHSTTEALPICGCPVRIAATVSRITFPLRQQIKHAHCQKEHTPFPVRIWSRVDFHQDSVHFGRMGCLWEWRGRKGRIKEEREDRAGQNEEEGGVWCEWRVCMCFMCLC